MAAVAPSSPRAWWLAARPRTLPVSLVPVGVGTAVAWAEGGARALPALVCALTALLLQLGTNFVNDYADHERGADGAERLGPPRAAQMGWLRADQLRLGAAAVLLLAALSGVYLIVQGGWPIAAAGALALVSAWAYTGGPYPLGYRGLGDLLVFAFFGLAAVVGTHYVQVGHTSPAAWASALPLGALATALLAVNNLRDRESDDRAGKRTVSVRLGERGARTYVVALVAGSFAALLAVAGAGAGAFALLPLASLPLALPVWKAAREARGAELVPVIGEVARLEVAFGALLALAWIASAWV